MFFFDITVERAHGESSCTSGLFQAIKEKVERLQTEREKEQEQERSSVKSLKR